MSIFEDKNLSPMLMYETKPFNDKNYIFELKLDGIRCLAYIDKKSVVLQNKRHKVLDELYPELSKMYECAKERCILDGELICINDGKPDFYGIQRRSLMNDKFKIKIASSKNPVQFVAYDILYLKDKQVTDLPLVERKKLLEENIIEKNNLSISRYIENDGVSFFDLAKKNELEGIVAKQKEGRYHIGKRTKDWVKIKVMQDEDLFIFGYQTDENGYPKDFILGYFNENDFPICRGKVYLGISKEERELVYKFAKNNFVKEPWFKGYKDTIWIKPKLQGVAHFMSETENGNMRQPVWKGIKEI